MYRIRLHWVGGVHTDLTMARNQTGQHGRSADRNVIELVTELAKVCPDQSIAAVLNRLGYKTGQGKSWNASRVAGVRGYHHIGSLLRECQNKKLRLCFESICLNLISSYPADKADIG